MGQSITIAYHGTTGLEYLGDILTNKYDEALTRYDSQLQFANVDGEPVVITNIENRNIAVEDYFDNEDIDEEFRELAPDLNYVLVNFRDIKSARLVLETLLSTLTAIGRCWVDSDYGWARSGEWFLEHIRRSPSWDWRTKLADNS